jgi:hypothetical protein
MASPQGSVKIFFGFYNKNFYLWLLDEVEPGSIMMVESMI